MKFVVSFLVSFLTTFFSIANTYVVFEENGKVGLKNAQGQVLIPAEYKALGWSNGSFSIVNNIIGYSIEAKWGLINIGNNKITKAIYEDIIPGEGNFLIVRKRSEPSLRYGWGCINTAGKEVIPFFYDGLKFSTLRLIVNTKIGNQYKYGLIDLDNKTLIPQHYQDIRPIGNLRFAVTNFEGKTALFADDGRQLTAFDIDSLSSFKKSYAILYRGAYRGLVDRNGQFKIEPKYQEVIIKDNGAADVREASEWFFLDGQNNLIAKSKADSIEGLGKNLLKRNINGIIHLTDHQVKPITTTTFSSIGKFKSNKALYTFQGYFGIVLSNGRILLPAIYHNITVGSNYFLVNQKLKGEDSWSLLDTLGVKRKDNTYEAIHPLENNFFAVRTRGFWGVIDFFGRDVIACAYDSLLEVKDQSVVVKFRGNYGVINLKEEWLVTPQPHKIKLLGSSRYLEYQNPTILLKSFPNNSIYFTDNNIIFKNDHLFEYLPSGTIWKINLNGMIVDREVSAEEATEVVFEEAEGLRAVKRNGKYGFIDSQGRLRIANRYEGAQKFNEGFAPVKILGKWGFINKQDNIAVQPIYEDVSRFKKGVAIVKQKGKFGIVSVTGSVILPIKFDEIKPLPSNKFIIIQDKTLGLCDSAGEIIIHPKYELIDDLDNGYVIVKREGKYGVVTTTGVSTIPLMYDYLTFDVFNSNFLAMIKAAWQEINLN